MYNGRYQTARNGAELKSDNTKVQPSAVVKRIKKKSSLEFPGKNLKCEKGFCCRPIPYFCKT